MKSRSFIEQTPRIEFDDFPGGPNRSCDRSDRGPSWLETALARLLTMRV